MIEKGHINECAVRDGISLYVLQLITEQIQADKHRMQNEHGKENAEINQ